MVVSYPQLRTDVGTQSVLEPCRHFCVRRQFQDVADLRRKAARPPCVTVSAMMESNAFSITQLQQESHEQLQSNAPGAPIFRAQVCISVINIWPCVISDSPRQRDPDDRLRRVRFLCRASQRQRLERERHVGRGDRVTRSGSVSRRGKHYQHFPDIGGCPWRHGHGSGLWVCWAHPSATRSTIWRSNVVLTFQQPPIKCGQPRRSSLLCAAPTCQAAPYS